MVVPRQPRGLREAEAFAGEPVDVRGSHPAPGAVVVDRQIAETEIVHQHQDDTGFVLCPSIDAGAGTPTASSMVGMMSTTLWNCERTWPFLALILAGQETASALRVPPKREAICLVHWKGVSIAWAQPTELPSTLRPDCSSSVDPANGALHCLAPYSRPTRLTM